MFHFVLPPQKLDITSPGQKYEINQWTTGFESDQVVFWVKNADELKV